MYNKLLFGSFSNCRYVNSCNLGFKILLSLAKRQLLLLTYNQEATIHI